MTNTNDKQKAADTCTIGGRTFKARASRRGCDGCAAMGYAGRRDVALCNSLPPCAGRERGRGPDIIWATRGAMPRKGLLEGGANGHE